MGNATDFGPSSTGLNAETLYSRKNQNMKIRQQFIIEQGKVQPDTKTAVVKYKL